MVRQFSRCERLFGLTGRLLFAILAVCCLTETACPQVNHVLPAYDVTPRPLPQIAPGTVIDRTAPPGWTYLVIKSRGRLAAGDLHRATAIMKDLAGLLFTAVLARVEAVQVDGKVHYRLAEVAAGYGTPIKGRDTILTPDTQQALGANLGLFASLLIDEAQKQAKEVFITARSETMLVFDVPVVALLHGKHRRIILRHALLVDEQTGRLYSLVWSIDRDSRGAYAGVLGPYQWLPIPKFEESALHLDGNEVNFAGIPSDMAIALVQTLQGQMQIPIPDAAKPLAGRGRLSSAMAAELEKHLRDTISQAALR